MDSSSAFAFLSRRSVGRTVLGLLGAGFVALLVIAVTSVLVRERAQAFRELVEHAQEVRRVNAEVMKLTLDAETSQRGYIITGDPEFLAAYRPAIVALPDRLARLRRLVSDNPGQVERASRLADAVSLRLGTVQRNLELVGQGRRRAALEFMSHGREQMDAVRRLVNAVDAEEARLLHERSGAAERTEAVVLTVNVLSVILIGGLATGSVLVVRRYIAEINAARAELDAVNAGLEETVATRTADLTRANEEIQRYAYIVTHDLRAPLVNVMGYTSELQTAANAFGRQMQKIEAEAPALVDAEARLAVAEDVPEAIQFIRASTAKMDGLINAILKLSREGRRARTVEPLDMTDMVRGLADSVKHQTEAAGAEILVDPLPPVDSDRLAMQQVFGNLIDNAVKYLDRSRPGRIRVSGREIGAEVVYEVEDNGRGIDPKDHARVFELFRRSGVQDRPGEGLGLAFVLGAVRRLGGTIEVESGLGRGATFRLRFPKKPTLTQGDVA